MASDGVSDTVLRLRDEVVRMVAGLDRGFAATRASLQMIDSAAMRLQQVAGPVCFSSFADSSEDSNGGVIVDQSMLVGKWRLIYSSAFATGGLGGERPGPPGGVQGSRDLRS